MNKDRFPNWLNDFGKAWEDRNPEAVIDLLSSDIKYYENALEEPLIGKEKVQEVWQVVPQNQSDVRFSGEVIMIDGNTAIANWKVKRIRQPSGERENIDGIFLFELNDNDKCVLFKQWRTSKIV
ncbi:MAG: nuclear transport factor 2 family protein [Candidatus Dojkabacteria bacterium]|jgi:hypothetical protein|nr:nuclear transport factor 2 family protein [Candidatus Dojkabacteria bacterium]